jgi:hypothetical protein
MKRRLLSSMPERRTLAVFIPVPIRTASMTMTVALSIVAEAVIEGVLSLPAISAVIAMPGVTKGAGHVQWWIIGD